MFRELVRSFFTYFVDTDEGAAPIARRDLIERVLAFAESRGERRFRAEGLVRALDAELGERFRASPQIRIRRGYYRFRSAAGPVASTMPPVIPRGLVEEFVPRERGQDRAGRVGTGAAQLFFSGELGGMDARTLVATNLLGLGPEEYASLFSLQGLAL